MWCALCASQVYRDRVGRLKSCCVRTSGRGPVCRHLLQTNGFHVRSRRLTYAWAWTTHSLSIERPRRFSPSDCGGPMDNDSSCFVWDKYMPSVHWWRESSVWSIVCCENERLQFWTPRVQLWPKMAHEPNPHGGWKEPSRHNNTHKISNWTLRIQTSTLALWFFLEPIVVRM